MSAYESPLFKKVSDYMPVSNTGTDVAVAPPPVAPPAVSPPFTGGAPVIDPNVRVNVVGFASENYKVFDPNGYTVLCETGKYCDALNYFPNSHTIVLEGSSNCEMLFSEFTDRFIPDLAAKLNVDEPTARKIAKKYFTDKNVLVRPKGIQGIVYNSIIVAQNTAPALYSFNLLSSLQTSGLQGWDVVRAHPLTTTVGTMYMGGIFFGVIGRVAGNNTLGSICNTTSYILTRPMFGVEVVLNQLFLVKLSNFTGLPLILNATGEATVGKGIKIKDFAKIAVGFERASTKVAGYSEKVKLSIQAVKNIWKNVKK
jgi:hypothetical protein